NNPSQQNKSAWTPVARIGLPLIYLLALIAPALVFFGQRGGFGFLSGVKDPQVLGLLLFPLVGLYAFTLIWAQVILGSSMPIWRRVYPWIETFHRTQGIFVLLFAGLHPTLLLLAYGQAYFNYDFVLPEQQIFIYIGQIQLLLIILTVATALLRKTRLVKKWWRYVHWANYLVFALVWIHSWELGSDVKPTWLRFVWIFFALTVVLSLLGRILRGVRQRKLAITPLAGAGTGEPIKTTFTRVATLSDLGQNKAHCLNVGGQAIVLYRINDRVFATTNTCTHAGGPLCEGSLKSTTVTCPWHGSQFDVTSGKVVAGPATRAVKTYPVRIVDGRVEIAL
ncbi:MAG: Rieske 2Fe-2S domain-containing protein, partial [bacterium]|nr:Rieske 2Fe-2S domain-containing protein [bacterium]